jgi:hypothetical protein
MESEPTITPSVVSAVIEPTGLWWAVAGGWAIDLWLGRQTRSHHDVEIVVRRVDQGVVYEGLAGEWEMRFVDPPGGDWRDWDGRGFDRPAFQAKALRDDSEFDLFFEDVIRGEWTFRRDSRVRRPLDELTQNTVSGLPVVRPEVQLLYMARHAEPKNRADLLVVLPELEAAARTWLRDSLLMVAPGHPWLLEIDAERPLGSSTSQDAIFATAKRQCTAASRRSRESSLHGRDPAGNRQTSTPALPHRSAGPGIMPVSSGVQRGSEAWMNSCRW